MNKKIIKVIKSLLCMSFVFLGFVSLYGRAIELNSRSRLFARINEAYLAVVQFYTSSKGCCTNQCDKEDYKLIKSRFNAVSQNSRFREAEIDFIIMNCGCDSSIASDFGISRFPTLMLFANGVPVQGAQLSGFVRECDINTLIENYLADDIDDVMHQKRKERKQKQAAQLAAWAAWAPCWYGGYGCCRPWGWGMYGGCGWGRGCGW